VTDIDIKPGQVWRRKSDGVETTVISADVSGAPWPQVRHQAKRLIDSDRSQFLRKYELVKEPEA
tara:strand:- start:2360 stop:2551 length:192 start_codon:yes stop_codon:yes gene_type:complete